MSIADELLITDELREYASGWRDRSCHEHLLAIADRIDERYITALYENIKLREQLQDAEHEESIAWDRVRSAERRNYKLRELLVDFRNDMWRAGEWTEPFDERMREMGIEVDI